MLYSRIDLSKTNYTDTYSDWKFVVKPDKTILNQIYTEYCRYKKFTSVMPIFDSQYTDRNTDIIGYYHNDKLVAFSLNKRHDTRNVESVQFAWNYQNSKLRLGFESLKVECALYKAQGFRYLYLGFADEYKKQIDGFEMLGSA
jgi:hypothetical protein